MIRLIVVFLTAVIVAAHATYVEVNAGSVLAFSLTKNLIVCTFMARWLSSLIGAIANIVLSNDSDADGPKKDGKKEKRQIGAESLSEAAFPTAGAAKSEPAEQAAVDPKPIEVPAIVEAPAMAAVRRDDMPAVWRFRPQKRLSTRVLAIRA